MNKLIAVGLALATLAVAGAVWAGAYIGQPALTQSEAGCWHPVSDKAYMENWIYYVRTDDGGFLYCVFMVSNLGLFNFNPGLGVSYYAPDGQVTANEFRVDNRRFHAATDRFDVTVGDARYWRDGRDLRLSINTGKIIADLTMTPTAAPWTAGTGRLPIGRGKESWNWIMPAPRGSVRGTLTVDGKAVNPQGRGYSDHYWSNKAYFTFSRNWLSFHVAGAKRSINFHQLVRTQKYGGDAARSLMMVADGGPARETANVEFEPLDWTVGQKFRQPKAFTLHGVIDGAEVTVEARNGRYGEIIDPIGSCSKIEQKIVRLLVADPMVYRLIMDAKITVAKDGRVEEEQGPAIAAMLYFEQ